jgi:hypothetical protein
LLIEIWIWINSKMGNLFFLKTTRTLYEYQCKLVNN